MANMSLQSYEDLIRSHLSAFLSMSNQIGNEVAEQAKLVVEAFKVQLNFLVTATQQAAPTVERQMQLLKPTSELIQAIQNLRERCRASPFFNHLSTISESIPALGWVTVSPAPGPYIKEMNDAGQFYANRVLKEWKEKNKIHADWVKCWIGILNDLQSWVKNHHTTGLVWSGKSSGAPPPPGGLPPPPPLLNLADLSINGASDNDRSALFAEINQGEDITKTLKKVTADMQTHKNASLRTGPAPFKAPTTTAVVTGGPKPATVKPPVFKRDGKKWIIEHYKDNHGILVEGTEMNNVVYVFGCVNCTLTVKGKINSIFVDSCRKTSLLFDTVVSSVEFVNCQSAQMQVLGKVPTITIDKTDGCQMYLNNESLDVEIVSSKSSEMNVLVPAGAGEYKEYPIPEQYRTNITATGLKTTAVENKG